VARLPRWLGKPWITLNKEVEEEEEVEEEVKVDKEIKVDKEGDKGLDREWK